MTKRTMFGWTAVAAIALAGSSACTKEQPPTTVSAQPGPPNNSYVMLTGTIVEAGRDTFLLDYGAGHFLVEMDDFDELREGYTLKKGDEVVVYGVVDDELHERRSIEAGSVYVRALDTQFYASSIDEEDFPKADGKLSTSILPEVALTGYVTKIAGDSMTLLTNQLELSVDLSTLESNLTDDVGHRKLSVGDQVHVIGVLSEGPLGAVEVEAERVVTLTESSG